MRESDDADNSSPEFPTSNARIDLTVSESAAIGTTVGTVAMATVPARDTLTYDLYAFTDTTTGGTRFLRQIRLSIPVTSAPTDAADTTTADTLARPDDNGFFSIDRATGRITLKSKLNHERMLTIDDSGTDDDDGQGKYIFFVRAKNSSGLGDQRQ